MMLRRQSHYNKKIKRQASNKENYLKISLRKKGKAMKRLIKTLQQIYIKILITLALMMLLSSCSTIKLVKAEPSYQENLLVKCRADLPILKSGHSKDVYYWIDNIEKMYVLCAATHNQLVEVIRSIKKIN